MTSAENKLNKLLMSVRPQEEKLYEQIIDLQDEVDILLLKEAPCSEIETKREAIVNLYNKIKNLNKPILDMREVIKKESTIFKQKCPMLI